MAQTGPHTRMLIISDDSRVRDQAAQSFQDRFRVIAAAARPDAVQRAEEMGPFALVLADLPPAGPERDGLIAHVNTHHAEAAVMLMDGHRLGTPRGFVLH